MSMLGPTTPCPHCGKGELKLFEECPECHRTFLPGDIPRSIKMLLDALRECPSCQKNAFDGWKCHNCGAEISDKARKAQGCVLVGKKETELVSAHFQKKDRDKEFKKIFKSTYRKPTSDEDYEHTCMMLKVYRTIGLLATDVLQIDEEIRKEIKRGSLRPGNPTRKNLYRTWYKREHLLIDALNLIETMRLPLEIKNLCWPLANHSVLVSNYANAKK